MKNRNLYLDLLRIFACLGVIGIHTQEGGLILNRIALLGLPLFFFISAYLLLPRCDDEHVWDFYKKRILKIVVPFLCYGLFYGCWIYPNGGIFVRPTLERLWYAISYIPHSLADNLTASIYFHFWYMYVLMGLYLFFPFLAKGLKALSDKGLQNLLILLLVMEAIHDFPPAIRVHYEIAMDFGWIIYIIFGYAFTRDYFKARYKVFVVLGAVAFAFQLFMIGVFPGFTTLIEHKEDLNPWEVLSVCGVFALFMLWQQFAEKRGRFHNGDLLSKVIGFVANYTFSVYLIHGYIISWWSQTGVLIDLHAFNDKIWWIVTVGSVFVLSFAFALVFDAVVVKNIQKLISFLYKTIVNKMGKGKVSYEH